MPPPLNRFTASALLKNETEKQKKVSLNRSTLTEYPVGDVAQWELFLKTTARQLFAKYFPPQDNIQHRNEDQSRHLAKIIYSPSNECLSNAPLLLAVPPRLLAATARTGYESLLQPTNYSLEPSEKIPRKLNAIAKRQPTTGTIRITQNTVLSLRWKASPRQMNRTSERIATLSNPLPISPASVSRLKFRYFILMPVFSSLDQPHNAAVMGLGELAAFLRLFAKRGTAYPNPNS